MLSIRDIAERKHATSRPGRQRLSSAIVKPLASAEKQAGARPGPPLLSFGFRPFFLFGSLYAALLMGLWLAWLRGFLDLPTAFPPVAWHAHELLFGYVAAAITGFLFTAIPGWTRRPPVSGWLLLALLGLWVVGRLAVNLSPLIGYAPAAGLSTAFLVAVTAVAGREIVAGGNWRNLKVVGLLAAFAASHAVYSWAVWRGGDPAIGTRMTIASVLLLLTLVAGRIVPSFTANWLEARGETVMPAPHARYDSVVVGIGALGLALWVVDGWIVPAAIVGVILLGSAGLHLVRQLRWRPHRTVADPLVAVLHGAYLFVPVGFALAGLALIAELEDVHRAAVHAWTVGAFGTMTLAVMTRASLGHTGRPLRASPATVIIYLSVLLAAATRIAAPLLPAWSPLLSSVAAVAWIAAFLGYAVAYGPMLLAPRRAA